MIVGAMILSWILDNPMPVKPLMASKLNTVAQVGFAALVLASLGFKFNAWPYDAILMAAVTILTLLSVLLYFLAWVRHVGNPEAM